MKVILKQDVEKLGKTGDIVNVAPGYGRNYLIPRKFAVLATPGNIKVAEIERLAFAKRDQRDKDAASLVAQELVKITVTVTRKTGEEGMLYGSVTALDIAEFLAARQIEIDKRKIQLDEPIKSIGEFQVPIRLHREVTVPIKVVVESEDGAAVAAPEAAASPEPPASPAEGPAEQ
ncbi:MAG: 50S ribosomal protein L9 [Acidobacteriota bacterium]|jgi:large subunit ribosomal protein L9|nr:50S ribosomal protein L9 [Acidobacteriota bacterium]